MVIIWSSCGHHVVILMTSIQTSCILPTGGGKNGSLLGLSLAFPAGLASASSLGIMWMEMAT